MKKLEAYKLNKAFTDGVEIRLDQAPDVVFLVKLPSSYNRGYSEALYSGLSMSMDDKGQMKTDTSLVTARYVQVDAFVDSCLVSIDGEPVPDNFQQEYPDAISELMEKASELVEDIESKVTEAVGKSSASSNGSPDGQEKKSSTPKLSNVAS